MIEKTPKYDLMKSIGVGTLIMGAYFFWFFNSGAFSEVRESYLMVVKDKITVSGKVLDVEEFEKEVIDGQPSIAYGYKYSFTTNDGKTFEAIGWNYAELQKNIQIEYISNNPKMSRVKGLLKNPETLKEWFIDIVALKFFGFLVCGFFAYTWVKAGIIEYNKTK